MANKAKTGIFTIDENYCIMAMPIDYALGKMRTGKNGRQYYEPIAYYGSINKCLREYLRTKVHSDLREKTIISLAEALETIQGSVQHCIGIINTRFPEYDVIKRNDDAQECLAGLEGDHLWQHSTLL